MVPRWGVSGNKDSGDESDEDVRSHFVRDFIYTYMFIRGQALFIHVDLLVKFTALFIDHLVNFHQLVLEFPLSVGNVETLPSMEVYSVLLI